MRILVSEASSPVAYQLLPLLAAGDVTHRQPVTLTLCDKDDRLHQLQAIAEDIRDCAFPKLHGVSITSNFLEATKSTDVIIVLPRADHRDCHVQKDIDVAFTKLDHIDFYGLGCAFHPTTVDTEMVSSGRARGPMSIAARIADVLKENHERSLIKLQYTLTTADLHEEAEFGCLPVPYMDDILMSCDHHVQPMGVQQYSNIVVMLVTANEVQAHEELVTPMDACKDTKQFYYARL